MEYWIADEKLPELEAALEGAGGAERAVAQVALAWAIRQRDSRRAAMLLDQARPLFALLPSLHGALRGAQIRSALTRCELALLFGASATAQTWLEQAQSLLPCPDAPELAGDVQLAHAFLARASGLKGQELQAYRACLAIQDALPQRQRQGIVRGLLALEEVTAGTHADPLQAVPELSAAGPQDQDAAVNAVWELARALFLYRKEPAQSTELYLSASEFALSMGMVRLSAVCTINAGTALQGLADYDGAAACFDEADELARRCGWPPLIGLCRASIGRLLRELGQLPASRASLHEALQAFEATPLDVNATTAHFEMAQTLLAMGFAQDAIAPMEKTIEHNRRISSRSNLCLNLIALGRILSAADQPAAALAAIDEAHALVNDLGLKALSVGVSDALAELHRRHPLPSPPGMTTPSAAVHYAEATLRDGLAIKGWKAPSSLYDSLAQVWADAGDHRQAYAYARQALDAKAEESTLKLSNPLALLRMLRRDDPEIRPADEPLASPSLPASPDQRPQPLSAKLLSPKERDVLGLVARGCSNKEIAQNLDVSGETVKSHLKSIYAKLQAGSRRHAVNRALSLGMIHNDA